MRAAALAALALLAGCSPYFSGSEWNGYETTATTLGRMRLDREPAGLEVTDAALAENFRRIAFGIEPDVLGPDADDPLIARPGVLRRWERPVRWQVTSLGPRAAEHRAAVEDTARRIARASGHDLGPAAPGDPANLAVLFLRSEDYGPARAAFGREPAGRWLARQIDRFGRTPYAPCVGLFLHAVEPARGVPEEIVFGLVLIRDELPPRLGAACVEEEMAQTMGLPNDDDGVRPSIFNDDQEFALMTAHDEALLRILYDERLSPGMTEEEAAEVLPVIIADMEDRPLRRAAE